MNNIWKDGLWRKEMETTHEKLRVGEKNSHNKKIMRGWQQYRIMNHRENGQDWQRKISFGLQNSRMMTRNTTMNCWGTPEWRIDRLSQRWKEFDRSWRNTNDWWFHSYVKLWENLRIALGKLEESGKILGKDLWVRAHSKETPFNDLKREIAPVELK